MSIPLSRPARGALPVQLGVAAAALALPLLLPPDRGAVLLLPVAPGASAARDAVGAGALLMGAGPVAGSLVVRVDDPGFAWRMVRAGVLPLAGPSTGCGDVGERRA